MVENNVKTRRIFGQDTNIRRLQWNVGFCIFSDDVGGVGEEICHHAHTTPTNVN